MIIIMATTLLVNQLFKHGKVPKIFGTYYCYYEQEDMGSYVPSGSLVVVKEEPINQKDIVLYTTQQKEYRIAVASLITDDPAAGTKKYYLTTATNPVAIEVKSTDIVGICTNRSAELGFLVKFLCGTAGMIIGLFIPCVILLIYLISVLIAAKESQAELMDDEDTDLAFVKSIQRKQQMIAERDAERRAREREQQMISEGIEEVDEEPEEEAHGIERARRMLTDEEIARLEEEEAARRAERIAAVRSHMEQRRQTETPDGVPLYTTEIITKTHTLSLPKTGDLPLTNTQPKELKPTPQENIPRLTATGHIQIPTPEQIAAEKQQAEALYIRTEEMRRREQESTSALQSVAPERKKATADDVLAEVMAARNPAPAESEPAPAPAAEIPAAEPAKPKKKRKKKPAPSIDSANFNDLMAFLNDEEQKLK